MGKYLKDKKASKKIDDIVELLHSCRDEGSLEVIASEILGYKILDDDIDEDNGASIIEECRMVLENISSSPEIDSLYKKLITHTSN